MFKLRPAPVASVTAARSIAMVSLAFALVSPPFAGHAAQAARIARIGFLSPGSPSDPGMQRRFGALRQGLRDLGYVQGRNLAVESRWAEGRYDRLPGLAAELVGLKVDVIVTHTPPAIQAAKQATATIPIVMAGVIDPLATGFVTSLAHPGGNITGLSVMAPELVGKQLEILKEVAPQVAKVALLGNPDNTGTAPQLRLAQEAARALGVRLLPLEARGPNEIDNAFAAMAREQAGALIVLLDGMLIGERARIAELSARQRLPAMYGILDHAEAGGLIAYGPSVFDRFQRAASFVDKILKGTKPGDLPVEQPTKFELVVNLRAAKALGLTIPPSILARADRTIE